jgi:hypothetical protein
MGRVNNQNITLLIPTETDAKNVGSEFKKVYLRSVRFQGLNSAELADLGLTCNNGVKLYFLLNKSLAVSEENESLTYKSWDDYVNSDDTEEYWSIGNGCKVLNGLVEDIDDTVEYKFTIREVKELRNKSLHHLEIVGV